MTAPPSAVADDPDLVSIIRAYNDVTERLKRSHEALAREVCRLREQLHEKNRELERRERLAALGQMAAGVAHEIRNPLGGIGLYGSLLERDLADRPEQLQIVRKMSAGVRNLESIVGDILAFAGDVEPNRHHASLEKIIAGARAQTAPQADSRGTELEVASTFGGVELLCDAGQIERALINLILNAIDAAGRGGHVWVRSGSGGLDAGRYRIVVEDDGPGIAPDLMQRVFDPFFTTKETGTGLGLAIVHRIAESNGGAIRVGSRPDGGAMFVLAVPLVDARHEKHSVGGNE